MDCSFHPGQPVGRDGGGAGASVAHGLRSRLTPDLLASFETGARAIRCITRRRCWRSPGQRRTGRPAFPSYAGWLFVAGTVLFSFSLYLLALTVCWLGAEDYAVGRRGIRGGVGWPVLAAWRG